MVKGLWFGGGIIICIYVFLVRVRFWGDFGRSGKGVELGV